MFSNPEPVSDDFVNTLRQIRESKYHNVFMSDAPPSPTEYKHDAYGVTAQHGKHFNIRLDKEHQSTLKALPNGRSAKIQTEDGYKYTVMHDHNRLHFRDDFGRGELRSTMDIHKI